MDRAYLAGYLDGEGCFSVSKRKDTSYKRGYDIFAVVTVSSVIATVVKEIWETYGGSLRTIQRNPTHKPLFLLTLAGKPCTNLIKDALPYLRLKTEQASLILSLQDTRQRGHNQYTPIDHNQRDETYYRIRMLNRRGLPKKSA